jgi:asparagine synthase (glutamine-hydrolysing)
MCGIAGVLHPSRSHEWLRETADRMRDAILHRGPDGAGTWTDRSGVVALAHRRLSILDLSPLGAQPMESRFGRYVISYNGEVYNFAELRTQLATLGHTFRGGSDTEVMLAAVEAWGLDKAVQQFVGMFAFALWDNERGELSLVRDRLGVKPLYWAASGPMFLFGSELKALLACSDWQARTDRNALAAFARWNYVPSPLCIFEGAAKLAPGCILTIAPGGAPAIRRYWDLRGIAREAAATPANIDDASAEKELERLLRDSVAKRMVADVPLGAFLSGGVDSSLVVALMQEQSNRPARTFTIGFQDPQYDEAGHARRVAQHLGTVHTELYVGPDDALAVIPEMPRFYDEPFADSSQVNMYLVSRMTRQHVTVALSGDGGDELFAGYTRYLWAELVRRRFLWLPRPLRHGLAGAVDVVPSAAWSLLVQAVPARRRPQRIGERARKLAAFLREPDADAIYRRQHAHWDRPDALVRGANAPRGLAYDETLAADVPDFIARMQLLDASMYLPDDIMTKVDRASMAVSLEAREPLLDHRLVEFAWQLPQHMKVRGGVNKWLLRRILHRYVPSELMERPKMGFSLPIGLWLRGPLRSWAEAMLDQRRLADAGYFDAATVRDAWTGLLKGRGVDQEGLWAVLMFEAWREQYGARIAPPDH